MFSGSAGYNRLVKRSVLLEVVVALALSGCDLFTVQPQPFPVWSPIPTRTPGIVSPTPRILTSTPPSGTPEVTIIAPITPASSDTPSPTFSVVPATFTETTISTPILSVEVEIIGCNTSLDITHGMGEVTNAFVTVRNTGAVNISNICSLLRAIDEDREHPDKQACVPNLPVSSEVNLKLTVDSAYKEDTAIQVDTYSNDLLLLRVDQSSCTDIGLFGGAPDDLGIVKPIQ